MPMSISPQAMEEKNKLVSSGVWLLLLEIQYPNENPIYLRHDTDINHTVEWDGKEWLPCEFQLGDVEETKEGEIPEINLTVCDIYKFLTPIVEKYSGGIGSTVIVRIVHSDHLDVSEPEFELKCEVLKVGLDSKGFVNFSLGDANLTNYRSPPEMFLKNHCRYKEFKGPYCGYNGSESECDRTYTRCKELGNQQRFGGFPGVGRLGFYV